MKIVLVDFEKIDFASTTVNCNVDTSLEQRLPFDSKDVIHLLPLSKENLEREWESTSCLFLPYSIMTADNLRLGQQLYFDLENYPFYQLIRKNMDQLERKGVLRFRRTVKETSDLPLLIGDLFVLTTLLGEPVTIQLKKSPTHLIVLIGFGNGSMAHVECTVASEERIEFEWSSVNTIIEFDSDQMTSIRPSTDTTLSITFSVDSIVSTAHVVTEELLEKLETIRNLIDGGDQK